MYPLRRYAALARWAEDIVDNAEPVGLMNHALGYLRGLLPESLLRYEPWALRAYRHAMMMGGAGGGPPGGDDHWDNNPFLPKEDANSAKAKSRAKQPARKKVAAKPPPKAEPAPKAEPTPEELETLQNALGVAALSDTRVSVLPEPVDPMTSAWVRRSRPLIHASSWLRRMLPTRMVPLASCQPLPPIPGRL